MSNKVICVLGMHRSGTSCLSGSLEEAGVSLGNVANESPNNLKGNKENKALRILNENLLNHNGGSWDNPPAALNWTDEFTDRRDMLIDQMSGHPIWAFKDPRSLLTLDFWLDALPNLTLVGTFRNPYAVSRSLLARKGLEPAIDPIDLWQAYNSRLLQAHDKAPFPIINFDQSMGNYNRSLIGIAKRLELQIPANGTFSFPESKLRKSQELEEDLNRIRHSGCEYGKTYEKLVEKSVF